MPRKKTTKRKTHANSNSYSATSLSKVEKEFFSLPDNLVKNANKQLNILQKKNAKLTKELAKAAIIAEKLGKKLSNLNQSKEKAKKKVANVLKKQHLSVVKKQDSLTKEHQGLLQALSSLEGFQAKFTHIKDQLTQLNKGWSLSQDKHITPITSGKIKKAKKLVSLPAEADKSAFAEETLEIEEALP